MVRKLGVNDYSSPSVMCDLVAQLRRKVVAGSFDAIGTARTTQTAAEILSQLGGGRITSTLPNVIDLPPVVTVFAPAAFLHEPAFGEAVWQKFLPLPQALENEQIRSVLRTKVAGQGLESIQLGIDEVRNGVSATKVDVVG